MKFKDLDLEPELHDGIASIGFEDTTPIQEQAIPFILDNHDLIACAQTGTGKTAAYLIPTINRLTPEGSEFTRALILAPTRELAGQIDQNVDALAYFSGVSSVTVIGGKNPGAFDRQKYALQNGADIIVATPGRLLIYLNLGLINFEHLEVVILDEADKMLDMGFHPDILKIFSHLPKERQTLMFSATMPKKIRKLAGEILNEPKEINLNLAKPAAGVTQLAYCVYDEQKIPLLEHIIQHSEVDSMIIFAASKASVDRINDRLNRMNFDVRAMHSDKSQEERQETLRAFKNKQFRILVGTDVLARGIDVDNLSHVLNYDVPHDAEDYVHRVGRTARANTTGEAITFITPRDQHKFARIEHLIESEVPKGEVPEEFGETPAYNPRKGRGGGGNRKGGRGGGRGRGDNNRGGGGRNRNDNRNRRPRNKQQDDQQGPQGENHQQKRPAAEGGDPDKPRKRRKRGGRGRRKPSGNNSEAGGGPTNSNPTPPAASE